MRVTARSVVIGGAAVVMTLAVMGFAGPSAMLARPEASWVARLEAVDGALARHDVSAAVRARQEAYTAALGSGRWEGMVAVGDATLRIGDASATRKAAEAQARQAYLTALFRARDQHSVEGVLRTAEAFAALGDRDVVAQSLSMARTLAVAQGDHAAQERIEVLRLAGAPVR
jgi:hypothetical protein